MIQALNGPSLQDSVSLTDDTVFLVKVGTNVLSEREVISIHPMDGDIWVFFGDGNNTPSASDVKTKGFPQLKGSLRTYEATDTQQVFIIADDGVVDVRFAERG